MANDKKSATDKRAVLYFLSGAAKGEALKLRRDSTIFGREKGDIIVDDSEASSTHCQIQNINGAHHIFDMNSTNGTMVNNVRIVKAKLNHNDVVTIGKTSFRFSLEDDAQVRHISTIFKNTSRTQSDLRVSLIDTLIEAELKSTNSLNIVLSVTYDDGQSENIELRQKIIYVGRASSFGRFEQDPEISRKHLLIKVNDQGEVFIEDQGSTNGTFLNGKKIKGMHLVHPTDDVKVGLSTLRITAKSS